MRYFTHSQNIQQKVISFNDDQMHHMRKVLRLKLDDKVEFFDDKGTLYIVEIKKLSRDGSFGKIIEILHADIESSKSFLTIMQVFPSSLAKLDLVIEKSTELGADRFIFIKSKRSELKVMPSIDKLNRWKKIAIKASEQSLRLSVPEIYLFENINEIELKDFDLKILLYEKSENLEWPSDIKAYKNILVTIGPEGGFEPQEVEEFRTLGFIDVKPFKNILRTETAPIATTAIIKN